MKKIRILFLFSILTFSPNPIMSQNQEVLWTSRFDVHNERSTFLNMSITPEGKLIVTGKTSGVNNSESFASFMNPDGVFESSMDYKGSIRIFESPEYGSEDKYDFATYDLNGNIFLAGNYSKGGSWVSRYSLVGIPKWENHIEKKVSFETTVRIKGMETDSNGNLIIFGTDHNGITENIIMKYDSVGRIDSQFGQNGVVDVGKNIDAFCIDSQGAIYISTSASDYHYTYSIKKYTREGIIDSTFGEQGEVIDKFKFGYKNVITHLKTNSSGDILALGWYDGHDKMYKTAFASYSANSKKKYSKIVYSAGRQEGAIPSSISINSKGEIALAVKTIKLYSGDLKSMLYRLSSLGEIIDTTQLPFILSRGDNKIVKKLIYNDDGTILVGGTTEVKGGDVITLFRISKSGLFDAQFGKNGIVYISWHKEYVEPELQDIAIDNESSIYLLHNQKILKLKNDGIADNSFNYDGLLSVPYIRNENSLEVNSTGGVTLGGNCQVWDYGYTALLNISSDGFTKEEISKVFGRSRTDSYYTKDIRLNIEKDIFVLTSRSKEDRYGIVKYSSTNVSLFKNIFGSWDKPKIVTAITLDRDGKILISGQSNSKITAFRHNNDGSIDSTFNRIGHSSNFESNGYTIKSDLTNRVLVSGIYNSNIAITRFNYNGSIDSTFGNNGILQTPLVIPFAPKKPSKNNFVIDEFGRIIVIGLKADYSNYEMTLIRYTEEGTIDSTFGEDGIISNDAGIDNYGELIELDGDGNIIAVGTGIKASIGDEYFPNGYIVIKKYNNLAPVVSVEHKEVTEVITDYSLSQNYPNPFNPSTKINYQIPKEKKRIGSNSQNSNKVTLKIYDVLGKEVVVLVNQEQPMGNYEVNFNSSDLSSGIYYYQLTAGSFMGTKKMIVLK